MNYVILTNRIPKSAYALGDGVTIQPILPLEIMFNGYRTVLPQNPSMMALTIDGRKMPPEVHNIARNFAVFHSFMSDAEEVFQHAIEKGLKRTFNNSDLAFMGNHEGGMDFDHFPLPIPKLSKDGELFPRNYKEVLGFGRPYPYEDSYLIVNYKDLFRKFCDFENAPDTDGYQLLGHIYSYIFIRSLWDISNIGLFYRNEHLSAMFYVAILENIIGEPTICNHALTCTKCGRKIPDHHVDSWRNRIKSELNILETGWGDKYIDQIMNIRGKRQLFAHSAAYSDLTQELRKIYDKRYYYGESTSEEDLQKERVLFNENHELGIMERTVRKLLAIRFLKLCGLVAES